MNVAGRNKEQRTESENKQTYHQSAFVTGFLHDETGGQRHDEITDIHRELYKTRLGFGHIESFLEMFVKNVQHAVGQPPEQIQCGNQQEGNQIIDSLVIFKHRHNVNN